MEESPWAGAVPGLHAGPPLRGAAGAGPGQGSRLCQARELARHRERALTCHMTPDRSRLWRRILGQILAKPGLGWGVECRWQAPAGRSGAAAPLSRPPVSLLPACVPAGFCLPTSLNACLLFCLPPAAFSGCGRLHPNTAESLKPVWASASSSVSHRALPGRAVAAGRRRATEQNCSRNSLEGTAGVRQIVQRWDREGPVWDRPYRWDSSARHSQGAAARASSSRDGEKPHQHPLTIASCLLAGSASLFVTSRHGRGEVFCHLAFGYVVWCPALNVWQLFLLLRTTLCGLHYWI
ncbi:uncharacterized protein LOC134419945 [Melospiza melodia melodia]|uniref:uncharacterized protein LOC134419945 n=1 Tax=Melospiza melodia melodia TaxID=1914991 RepID=UPI002FCEBB31